MVVKYHFYLLVAYAHKIDFLEILENRDSNLKFTVKKCIFRMNGFV